MKIITKKRDSLIAGLACLVMGILFLALKHEALMQVAKEHGLIITGFSLVTLGIMNLIIWKFTK
jgi:hypothetical protein